MAVILDPYLSAIKLRIEPCIGSFDQNSNVEQFGCSFCSLSWWVPKKLYTGPTSIPQHAEGILYDNTNTNTPPTHTHTHPGVPEKLFCFLLQTRAPLSCVISYRKRRTGSGAVWPNTALAAVRHETSENQIPSLRIQGVQVPVQSLAKACIVPCNKRHVQMLL